MTTPLILSRLFDIIAEMTLAYLAFVYWPTQRRGSDAIFGGFLVVVTAADGYSQFQEFSQLLENFLPWPAPILPAAGILTISVFVGRLLNREGIRSGYWSNHRTRRAGNVALLIIFTGMGLQTVGFVVAGSQYNMGKQEFDKENWDTAIEFLSRAISLDPGMASAYNLRGMIHHLEGDLDKAIADHTKAIEINHGSESFYSNRAAARTHQQDLANAVSDYHRSIAINPNRAFVYLNRGLIYSQLGQKEQAQADFSACLHLEPGNERCQAAAWQEQGSD